MVMQTEHVEDRDVVYRRYHDGKQEEFLRTLVCDDVIEEHRQKPLGQHSEPLERLLLHFRGMPMANKLAIKRDEATATFRLIAFSGERGVPPRLVDDTKYKTLEEAYHAIFLRRIEELMESK